jgi:hypothetical protein
MGGNQKEENVLNELDRDEIINAIYAAVEPLPFVIAMWEGGSAAWDRENQWSDIDLQLLVDDEAVSKTIDCVDEALLTLSPVDIRFVVPQPTWHGHEQVFYRLRDAGEYRLVDLAVMRRSSPNQLNEYERHGVHKIIFDKTGEAKQTSLDRNAHGKLITDKLRQLSDKFPLFQCLVKKDLLRGNPIGAIVFYYSHTLFPLLTLLRIRHCPDRFGFGPRYAAVDLPPEVVQRVEPLWFVGSVDEIETKRAQVEEYFTETMKAIKDQYLPNASTPELDTGLDTE